MDKPLDFTEPAISHPGFGGSVPHDLSMDQVQWLLKNLSTDDRKAVADQMRNCTSEMVVTRGLPLAAVLIGSMYYARQRLPTQYHFGPKGWPFYALIGFGSVTLSTLLTTNTCANRLMPILSKMYDKYSSALPSSANSYDSLRMANRARLGGAVSVSDVPQLSAPIQTRGFSGRPTVATDGDRTDEGLPGRYHAEGNAGYAPLRDSAVSPASAEGRRGEVSLDASNWLGLATTGVVGEEPSLMSGTPYRSRDSLDFPTSVVVFDSPPASSSAAGKSQYGDIDFS